MSEDIAYLFSRIATRYPMLAIAFLMGLPEKEQREWRAMYTHQWLDAAIRLGV